MEYTKKSNSEIQISIKEMEFEWQSIKQKMIEYVTIMEKIEKDLVFAKNELNNRLNPTNK